MEVSGKYYFLDGLICAAGYDLEMPEGDATFYEVIRTFAGIPLFFDDHVTRLKNGISSRYSVPERLTENIRKGITSLAECDLIPEINVRVMVTFRGKDHSLQISYIPSSYPDERMYETGVKLILFNAVRSDPEIKILNSKLRSAVNDAIAGHGAYEALLVNQDNIITEGSRSNVFFVSHDHRIFTAPDSMVLSGITRKYVIEICRDEGIEVVLQPVKTSQIAEFRSVFITGTSPMVLPVESIDEVRLTAKDAIVRKLHDSYAVKAEQSIRKYLTEQKEDF